MTPPKLTYIDRYLADDIANLDQSDPVDAVRDENGDVVPGVQKEWFTEDVEGEETL